MFYFAWADSGETTFNAGHEIEDESIFSLEIQHFEGEFAEAVVIIKNPKIGLLGPGRKKWVWISEADGSSAGPMPLFFGRLTGIPERLGDETATLTFVARPIDWAEQRETLAETLKVAPFYDPVFLSAEQRADSDAVLEGRSQLWHIDRTSLTVTASDILAGEDGTINLAGDYFYDSLDVTKVAIPARTVRVDAQVQWDQAAIGEVDFSAQLLAAFAGVGSSGQTLQTYTGQGFNEDYPKDGARMGSGWEVGEASLKRADGLAVIQESEQVLLKDSGTADIPLWSFRPVFKCRYDVSRQRSERVTFNIESDMQEVVTDAGDEEILQIDFASADVDQPIDPADSDNPDGTVPIEDIRRTSYFQTDRGKQSVEHLIVRARAALLRQARAVEITIKTNWQNGLTLSCRKNVSISDGRLPGGTATGKIIGYILKADGASGTRETEIKFGCAVGNGASVSTAPGSGDYAEDGYMESGYQTRSGELIAPVASEITYEDFSNQAIVDDGVNFFDMVPADLVVSIGVTGGPSQQRSIMALDYHDFAALLEGLNAVYTEVDFKALPLKTGPFETDFAVTVSQLMVPKHIDLEAV